MSYWTCPPTISPGVNVDLPQGGRRRYTPPCQPLLTDTLRVLNVKSRWPKHLCENLLRDSTEAWATKAFYLVSGDMTQTQYRSFWPLPIGQQSVLDAFRRGKQGSPGTLVNAMPFTGREYAALALRVTIGNLVIDLFGMAQPRVDEAGIEAIDTFIERCRALDPPPSEETLASVRQEREQSWLEQHEPHYALGRLAYVVRASGKLDPSTVKLLDTARRCWAPFIGERIGPGRTVGSTGTGTWHSKEHFIDVVGAAIRALASQHKPVTARAVLDYLSSTYGDHDDSEMHRWLANENWKLPKWTDFVSAILGGRL